MDTLFDRFNNTQNNPYVFAVQSRVATRASQTAGKTLSSDQKAVLREQHRILFAHDSMMRDLFDDDFEDYFSAIQKPDAFVNKIKSFLNTEHTSIGIIDVHAVATYAEDAGDVSDGDILTSVARDPLFRAASAWVEAICAITALYPKEIEAFRLLANAQLVPAKIVAAHLYTYSYMEDEDDDADDEDDADMEWVDAHAVEAELHQYTLANIFLARSRESLALLSGLAPERTFRYLQTHAEHIASQLRDRMLECAAELR